MKLNISFVPLFALLTIAVALPTGKMPRKMRLKSLRAKTDEFPLKQVTDQLPHKQMQPEDYPSPKDHSISKAALPRCKLGPDKDKCNVLVVVDMQNDYCKGCGSPTESKWASEGVKEIVDPINSVIEMAGENLDLVVFTQDWLKEGTPFLVHNTSGSQVIDELTQPEGKSFHFTKTADDWMNHGYYEGRQYAIEGEAGKTLTKASPLDAILESYGYTPEKTQLYVVGTATYRCVLKGSVHAKALGYSVSYVANAVEGDGDDYDWNRYADPCKANGVQPTCRAYMGGRCSANDKLSWMESIYTTRGGPSPAMRQSILANADVRRCANADAVVAALGGTPCPMQLPPIPELKAEKCNK